MGEKIRAYDGGYSHWCPGCEERHFIAVDAPLRNGAQWSFDGNHENPSFSPSVRIHVPDDGDERVTPEWCHYFIKRGQIEYCGDSTHEFAGRTIPLPDIPD